ncbi:MAG: right-handed parallel beta-helix repeat-containing protein [Lachnospiraceae bacterium]|nr:right-handed parallel beta-helix repeat-containing protein [Lachnospiraceae bacterium]
MKVSVIDFGAVPNGEKVQTGAFQAAIDECFRLGGGEVAVPKGTYVIGDIRLRSNITLHLLEDAVLLGSLDPKDYRNILEDAIEPLPKEQRTDIAWMLPGPWQERGGGFKEYLYCAGSYWNYGMIRGVYAENVAVIGEKGSVIDGRNVYDSDGEENYRGPHGINMHFCKNVTFKGYTITNTGNWAHAIFQSENIQFDELTVLAGHDALHTRACSKVSMTNCKLITGDDCIAGFDNLDVIVRNCEISSACSAFRYGGNNILIEDCYIYGPCKYQFRGHFSREEKKARAEVSATARNNMLSFFTYFVTDDLSQRKAPGNIVIRNCKVTGADRLLHINLSGNEGWQRGNPPTDITFENIEASGIKTGLYAYGDDVVPYRLYLKNVQYSVAEGWETEPLIKAAHFGEINLQDVSVFNYEGNALIKIWSEGGKVSARGLACKVKDGEFVVRAEEAFVCDAI